jgi:FtsP/CotA-like multicopper oxidase with cupredoxin domain
MASDKVSRRQILGMGAASVAAGIVVPRAAHANQHAAGKRYQPVAGPPVPSERRSYWDNSYSGGPVDVTPLPPGLPGEHYTPVVVPNGAALPFRIVDGAKVFHVIVSEVDHEFDPGLRATCWAYNGRVNSTVIEAVEGERVRIYVTNRLSVPTSIHWHGVFLPNGMDGVAGLTQPYIKAGETAKYEWTVRQHGTFMFHSHHDEMTQMGMGLVGMLIFHPRNPAPDQRVDRDFSLMISEWAVKPGTSRPNTLEMTDFNVLTINGKVFPSTAPLVCKTGDRVRIRLGNLGATDHHPMHIHGHRFRVAATDGDSIPLSAQWPESTVLVGASSGTR